MLWFSRKKSQQTPVRPNYVQEAIAYEGRGDFDQAISSLRLALRERPNDSDVLQNLACVYTKAQQYEPAIRIWERVLSQYPQLPAPHYGLGFLYLHQGNLDLAAQHLNCFLAEPPMDVDAREFIRFAQRTRDALARRLSQGGVPSMASL